MSLGDAGDRKDIRKRADDFLTHGVLGCCPETKAALGKTVADSKTPKQPEKKLPNVVNQDGYRYDPSGKWQQGAMLNLFPGSVSRQNLAGQPNFGWVQGPPDLSPEESVSAAVAQVKRILNGPRVVQEVWEVDKEGNPTKLVRSNDDESDDEPNDDVKGKGLGRTLREMNPGNTLIARAAKRFGVWVDDLGKFRCPPGTPQANQFTDEFGTTCFAIDASQVINAAQEGFASLGAWWARRRQRRLPFFVDEFGNVTENIDIIEGRQEYRRVFTGARSRVRSRMKELESNVSDLLEMHGIKPSSTDNSDLEQLIKRLAPDLDFEAYPLNDVWNALDPREKQALQRMGITKQSLVDTERGYLMKIAELALTDPDRLSRIGVLKAQPDLMMDGDPVEALTWVTNSTDKARDVKYSIKYDPLLMAKNAVTQLEEVKENQRLGLRVRNAASNEEAADALHKFVVNESQWAGGMVAALGENIFMAKGVHTSIHELSHTVQIDKFIDTVVAQKGLSAQLSDLTNGELIKMMMQIGDEVELEDIGLVLSDLEKVAFMGGRYGAQVYEIDGAVSDLWKLEASAELYALREMGVIEGDDVDRALSWMDDVGATRTRSMREAAKKKNRKIVEDNARRPQTRPDGRPDHPDSPAPAKPRKARPVRDAKAAGTVGRTLRRDQSSKFDKSETEALQRVGDPRNHQVISLVDPEQMTNAILGIDSNHKIARKHGVDLDEVDVSTSAAVNRVAYDPKRKRLYVTYENPDGSPANTYYYRDVEPETVLDLHKAEVKGRAINEIKRTHPDVVRVDSFPQKIDPKSLDDADIASQVQFNLIPTLSALDKAEVGREMRVVISVDRGKSSGGMVEVRGITTARIYHDGIDLKDDEVVLSVPADGRGIPVDADFFDREETGSTTLLMMPPMKIAVLDDKDGRRAELVDQQSSDVTLSRMIDDWPSGADAKEGRTLNMARRKTEEITASYIAAGEGSSRLPDGSTTPMSARRIRTRNADIHERQTKRKSSPTKPTKAYRDLVTGRGFPSMGEIETPEERGFSRTYGHSQIATGLLSDVSVDPEVRRIISNADERQVSKMVDAVAVDFHEGVDRRPRLRVSTGELDKVISDGGRSFTDRGHFSNAERAYQSLIGIHPDTDDIDRPIVGYVIHPAQDQAARDVMRKSGTPIGDAPIEWPLGSNPHGDVDTDGEIEIVLKPEVSGRTAYGFGYGMDNRTRPVWLNSTDPSDISDALVHIDAESDPEGSRMRMLNALSASVDGNYGYLTDMGSVKPAATNQNEKTSDYLARVSDHARASKPQRLGAQIMGGFVNEEIAEIRYPWSRIASSSSDMDISDVVNKEPVSDRLRRLGFTDEEIEYFYKMNGDRSLDYISSATMSSLREYRKALEVKQEYEARGIPAVSFAHPAGIDPLDIASYMADPLPGSTVEDALAKAINEEVDALVEKMLKQVRKTRGKLWEMKPKVGARA